MSIKTVYEKSKILTGGFKNISTESIMQYPQILKIFRLALNMPVHEFEKKFLMHQQSRFERGLIKPARSTAERFIKIFEKFKEKCCWNIKELSCREESFTEKLKAGELVGSKTLFRTNDLRTQTMAKVGAKLGGAKTFSLYGREHMAELARKIQRGRKANDGYRSSAEKLVSKALDRIGISTKYEQRIGRWLPDFVFDKTIIEVLCTNTPEYWKRQELRLKELSEKYKIIAVTNKPEKVPKIKNITVVKFSKSLFVLESRMRVALSRNENPRVATSLSAPPLLAVQ